MVGVFGGSLMLGSRHISAIPGVLGFLRDGAFNDVTIRYAFHQLQKTLFGETGAKRRNNIRQGFRFVQC